MSESKKKTPPPGVEPLMMTEKMMAKYEVKTGDGERDVVAFKTFTKEFALKEVQDLGFYSAFHPFRNKIEKYSYEEILVISDVDEVYGDNWLICVTEEAFDREIGDIRAKEKEAEDARRAAIEAEEAARREAEAEKTRVYVDGPVTPRAYESETGGASEAEVRAMTVRPTRPAIKMVITRTRYAFGGKYNFSDRELDGNAADVRQRKEPNYELQREEMDVGLQACAGYWAGHRTVGTQTTWFRHVSSSVQCDMDKDLADMPTPDVPEPVLCKFLTDVVPLAEYALQQNETLDIFQDELARLDEDDVMVVGSKGENSVRELRTFMDLELSNNKALVAVDWHPHSRSRLATSAVSNIKFDDRVADSGRAATSHILIYTFAEFSAQIILESPHDITVFRWSPSHGNIIAAGCVTGQCMIFDLTEAMETLSRQASGVKTKSKDKADKAVRVSHVAISTIDFSHKAPVADVVWLPATHQISSKQQFFAAPDEKTTQFVTIASDGQILAWDTNFKANARRRKSLTGAPEEKKEDINWMPVYRVQLQQPGKGTVGITRISFDPECCSNPCFVGTEEGQLVLADWAPLGQGTGVEAARKGKAAGAGAGEGEEGEEVTEGGFRVLWAEEDHYRPVVSLIRSPFFHDVVASVGDWCFTIWREGMRQPLFHSPQASAIITLARWSPTRPAILFVAKIDGTVDIWDLVDQTHRPSFTSPVVSSPIMSMEFRSVGSSSKSQLLAVGDAKGYLHIMDIPHSLRKTGTHEKNLMAQYLEREAKRVSYVKKRVDIRSKEKVEKDAKAQEEEQAAQAAEQARQAEIAAAATLLGEGEEVDLDELEREKVAKKREMEENKYQELEKKLREELGITDEYDALRVESVRLDLDSARDGSDSGLGIGGGGGGGGGRGTAVSFKA